MTMLKILCLVGALAFSPRVVGNVLGNILGNGSGMGLLVPWLWAASLGGFIALQWLM